MNGQDQTTPPSSGYSTQSNDTVALTNCIEVLLHALGWVGNRKDLIDALPYYTTAIDINDYLYTMNLLGYRHHSLKLKLKNLDPIFAPCLFVLSSGKSFVILKKQGDKLDIFDGATLKYETLNCTELCGKIYFFKHLTHSIFQKAFLMDWFEIFMKQFHGLFMQLLSLNFILSVFALSVPLFSMLIYDQVIATSSIAVLKSYLTGIIMALLGIGLLQYLQARVVAYIGIHINDVVGNTVLERLLLLPASFTESASGSAQVARIRDFDHIRGFFTTPLFNLVFELPFALTYIVVIALLGGNLAFVPLTMITLYALIIFMMKGKVKRSVSVASLHASEKHELTLEAFQQLRFLKYAGLTDVWSERYLNLSAETAISSFKNNMLNTMINIMADVLMMLSAIAIVGFGSLEIIKGQLTVGALIAIMMLVWRTLVPFRVLFANQTHFNQLLASIRQLNALMKLEPERKPYAICAPHVPFKGNVCFENVSLRYPKATMATLTGVTFTAKPGEVIAIVGRNGSGKSSLFKLLLGLYPMQSGAIYLDGEDIRQIDPIELRRGMSYVPARPSLFYGTIAQNLYLVNPTATEEALYHSVIRAELFDDIMALPEGFQTHIDDQSDVQFPASFLQRLSLARAYLKKSPIVLLDEPGNALDQKGEEALRNAIEYFRGNATIFINTHRPSHIKLADQILLLHDGHLLLAGQSNNVMVDLPKEFLP